MIRTAFGMAMVALVLATTAPAGAQPGTSAMAFETMKEAVGTWRPADRPDSPLRIRFYLTAGGTVLVEEWTRNGQPHSLTLYHRDGADLIATHYCPQGNQPRLAVQPQADPGVIRFAFRDVTDLDPANESHAVALVFDLSNEQVLVRQETYRRNDTDEHSELRLVRES
ncbi:hypothetical protein [Brevundimonas sp.]|uniref:hypothetical protein n=1 Tax=Brevundimonas sp. TaxID=1871086 RepID=UPI003AF91C07